MRICMLMRRDVEIVILIDRIPIYSYKKKTGFSLPSPTLPTTDSGVLSQPLLADREGRPRAGEAMVERPLHRTPTCLSGEWDAVQDRAPQGGPSLSTAIACEKGVRSRVALQPHPSMWGEDAPPLAEGELGQANSNLGGT